MVLTWPAKDPDEVLDYQINWTARVDDDTIATSTWIVDDGITQDSDTFSDSATTIWLSGGTVGELYSLVNRITTTGGRTMDQTVHIKIKAR